VACASSLPSGAPWLDSLPALFGEPKPMVVRQQMSVGLSLDFSAVSMAVLISTGSWPSTRASCWWNSARPASRKSPSASTPASGFSPNARVLADQLINSLFFKIYAIVVLFIEKRKNKNHYK